MPKTSPLAGARRAVAPTAAPDTAPLRIGISACLLGSAVRWDGGHKRDPFLVETLGPFVEWVAVCPEVELGMGVPRETVRLQAGDDGPRMLGTRSGADHTRAMKAFATRRVAALEALDLSGYVLKKDSPSCGMERVRVYRAAGPATRDGRGLFAATLLAHCPRLPVEEEGRLHDPRLRENFVERVFAYRRLRGLLAHRVETGALVRFHTAHKLTLLAHDPEAYRALGRLVAGAKGMARAELRRRYEDGFMAALRTLATTRKHTNVLQHVIGHLRHGLEADARAELVALIEDYRRGLVPLVAPLVLIRHHVRRIGVPYLEEQTYLAPHPKELMLRNHV